jgi:hypothetical protein
MRHILLSIPFLLLILSPAVNAQTVSVPHVFTDGSIADADEINANFAALVAAAEIISQLFLTTNACPSGYAAVEQGYIRLGSTGLTTIASPRTLSSPGHGHSHSLQNDTYPGHLATDLPAPTPGTSPGHRVTSELHHNQSTLGAHNHTITGTVGSAVVSGDTPQDITGDLEHITLRLCVRSV